MENPFRRIAPSAVPNTDGSSVKGWLLAHGVQFGRQVAQHRRGPSRMDCVCSRRAAWSSAVVVNGGCCSWWWWQFHYRQGASDTERPTAFSLRHFSAVSSVCRVRYADSNVNYCCSPASTNPRNHWFYHPNYCDNTPKAIRGCPTPDSVSTLCVDGDGDDGGVSVNASSRFWTSSSSSWLAPISGGLNHCLYGSRHLRVINVRIW